MTITNVLQFIVTALVVTGMAWVGAHNKSIKQIVVWVLVAAFVTSLLFSLHRLWPTEFVAAELQRTGNTKLYLTWNIQYFFIDFIPLIISTGILALGASITSWFVSVRLNKPKWISIISGILVALVLLIPAIVVGIMVLVTIIPGSWP